MEPTTVTVQELSSLPSTPHYLDDDYDDDNDGDENDENPHCLSFGRLKLS
jgi:hypothetical protein